MTIKKYISKTAAYSALAGLLSLSVISCKKDFMDKLPETEIGEESFFNTEEDLNLYVNGLYNFPSSGFYTDEHYLLTDNGWTTGAVELKTMMTGNPNSSTITSGWDWTGLRRINLFLANFNRAKITQERLNHFEGLGRFFRARFYWNKVKRYSDVPWINQVVGTSSDSILFAGRDSREMVVNKILEDYDFAINNIDLASTPGAVNRWVAKADYARFLLFEGTYRKYHSELNLATSAEGLLKKAADVAKDIMDNGGYSISMDGGPDKAYFNLFDSPDLVGNPEMIFVRRYKTNILNGDNGDGVLGNYESYPIKNLVQAYLMTDGSFYSSQPGYQENEFVEEFTGRDPRLSQTYAYPGWELLKSGTYAQGTGLYVQQLQKNFSGYHQIKGFKNYVDANVRNEIDAPLYRYAEILLIYAEARAELGVLTQADLDITVNKIRDRVFMPHLIMPAAIDPVEAERFPNVTGSLAGEIYEIRRERRVELAFEGQRHDDLMRWEAAKSLEKEPQGIYFSSLGKKDLTGDGVPDINLIPASETIPLQKEKNSLGKELAYYRVGTFGQDASFFMQGTSGNIQIIEDAGVFDNPKYYYRPVPQAQVALNPNLTQIFGWK